MPAADGQSKKLPQVQSEAASEIGDAGGSPQNVDEEIGDDFIEKYSLDAISGTLVGGDFYRIDEC